MRDESKRVSKRDIEICKERINELLREFNCDLISQDEWSGVLILDKDTQETLNARF